MSLALSRPIVLALVLLGAAVPAGIVAPMAAAGTCDHGSSFGTTETIQRSSPLAETTSATELVYRFAHAAEAAQAPATHHGNGVDAYVYEMSCIAGEKGLTYQVHDRTHESFEDGDYALAFYTEDFRKAGDTVYDKQREDASGQLAGYVPEDTRYVVVILEDGPLMSGMDHDEMPPEPYSVKFQLTLEK